MNLQTRTGTPRIIFPRAFIVVGIIAALLPLSLGMDSTTIADASGTPNVTVNTAGPSRALIGSSPTYTIRACNQTATNGYNLSYRTVLPANVGFGSAVPAATTVLANKPAAGQTTVIWENTSDLLAGACVSINLTVATDADNDVATLPVGTTFDIVGEAYVNSNAFYIPDFDANGLPITGSTSYTGSGVSAPASTEVAAFILDKVAGNNGESELTRGVHGPDPKTYTLTVTNNGRRTTNNFSVVDVLPPELEFLGCTNYLADSTTSAPTNPGLTEEYIGSGPLAGGTPTSTCLTPSSIETLSVPTLLADGTTAPAGSTRVTWNAAALGSGASQAANGVLTITYLAGIPLKANTATFTGAKPTDASLLQGRNLDNNNGPLTSETATEQGVVNRAAATGTYQGPSTSGSNPTLTDTDSAIVAAEDLLIRKSSAGTVVQGTIVTNTLTIETGEYRDTSSLVVTDTLPNGTCPLGNLAGGGAADPACSPSGSNPTIDIGGGPVAAPYTSATENSDGTWTLVWNFADTTGLASVDHDRQIVMTQLARVRPTYRANGANTTAVLLGDSMTNNVSLTGNSSHRVAIVADTTPDLTVVNDVSDARIDGVLPTMNKRVSVRSGSLASGGAHNATSIKALCSGGTVTWAEGDPIAEPGYRPGDYVCFDLQALFPSNVDSAGVGIADLLPPNYTYVMGSATRVTAFDPDTLPGTTVAESADLVSFTVGASGNVTNTGETFHWTIAARVGTPPVGVAADIVANLQKMTIRNTNGEVFQFRDQANAVWTEPQIRLTKGVRSVSGSISTAVAGPLPANSDNRAVQANDLVTYRVDLQNTGNVASTNTEVWDVLPTGIDCSMVTAVDSGGSCPAVPGTRVVWPSTAAISVPAGASIALGTQTTLTYQVAIPGNVEPGHTFVNTAGVRSYEAATNASDSPQMYYPTSNIDGTVTPNTDAARDTSSVYTPQPGATKVQRSSIGETANSANASLASTVEQATIGETITYSTTLTIPQGTTTYSGVFTDAIPAGLAFAGNDSITASNPTLGGSTLSAPVVGSNGTITVTLPTPYVNAVDSGADTLTLQFDTKVLDTGANARSGIKQNRSTFNWRNATAVASPPVNSNYVNATIVEPRIVVAKTNNTAGNTAAPGQAIGYTLFVTNPTAASVSVSHGVSVVDTVPTRIQPTNSGVPVLDGGSVSPDGGIWDATARTITWSSVTTPAKLTSIAPAGSTALTYTATVDEPVVASSTLVNTVIASTSSMAGTVTGERSYTANSSNTISINNPTITKTVTPTTGTVGTKTAYSVLVTVPASTRLFDATVIDTMPDGMIFDGYGTITQSSGPVDCPDPSGFSGITPPTANGNGTTSVGWWFGDITVPSSGSCQYLLTFNAHVAPVRTSGGAPIVGGNTLVNSVQLAWNTSDVAGPATPGAVPAVSSYASSTTPAATATFTVQEPTLRIDKDVSQTGCDQTPGNISDGDSCATTPGSSYTYTVRVTNSGSSAAYDATITDQPSANLTNVVATGAAGITLSDGWTAGDPDIVWLVDGPIAAGGFVTITYTADLVPSALLSDADVIQNTADVPTYFGIAGVERSANPSITYRTYGNDPSGPGGNVTADSVDMTVKFPSLTVAKTVISDATDARVGQNFTWQIVVTNATGSTIDDAFNVDVGDVLPADWGYVNGSARVTTPYATSAAIEPGCAPSCATGGAISWPNLVSGAGQPLAPGATITVRIDTTPTSAVLTVPKTGSFDHTNTASVTGEDRTNATANVDGSFSGPDATASARLRRADLRVTKSVSAGPYYYGADVDYTITLTNDGPDTATNVRVDDLLPSTMAHRITLSQTQGSYVPASGQWTIGTVNSTESVTLVIRARFTAVGTIANTAEVGASDQWDPDSTPANGSTAPTEDDTSTVTITTQPTSLGNFVWFDANGDEIQDSNEPGIPSVTVTLQAAGNDGLFGTADDFWGPDGIASTTDDIATTSTTTNSTGSYSFVGLPVGDYRVTVDSLTLPNGLAQTFDDDANSSGTLDNRSGVITLTSTTPYLDADFGYTGTGSIGDTVWEDANADGTIDGAEVGIADVNIVVVWSGFDGIDGNADDVAYFTSTAPDGTYLVGALPAGKYKVALDPSSLAVGLVNVFDPDATRDGESDTTLTGGQNRTDMDFGYRYQADLAVTKTHEGNFRVGASGIYIITVDNLGPAAAAATVVDTLPVGLAFASMVGDDFDCAAVDQVVTCISTGPLAPGSSVDLTLSVLVSKAAAPSTVNTATVSSPVFDPELDNNTTTDPTVVPYADVSLIKSLIGNVQAGENAEYSLAVSNAGPSVAPAGLVVTDPLPAGLAFVSASGTGWTCKAAGKTVSCTSNTSITVGNTSTIALKTAVSPTATGSITNSATVAGATEGDGVYVDPDSTNNGSSAESAVLGLSRGRLPLAFTGGSAPRFVVFGSLMLAVGFIVLRKRRRSLHRQQ